MNIRPASHDEGWRLREIEIASKAYWGYPYEFMERFAKVISMTPDYIRRHEVWVVDGVGEIAGFYGLIHQARSLNLTTFGSYRATSARVLGGTCSSMLSSGRERQVLSGWNGKQSRMPRASISEWVDATCEPRRGCLAPLLRS